MSKAVDRIKLTGHVVDFYEDEELTEGDEEPFADGDIQIQPRLDMYGRFAASGGHTNYGFSGFFRGYVTHNGKRRRLVDWYALFPNNEHHYASQLAKPDARDAIVARVEILSGTYVVKVKGGYAFDPEEHEKNQLRKLKKGSD